MTFAQKRVLRDKKTAVYHRRTLGYRESVDLTVAAVEHAIRIDVTITGSVCMRQITLR